MLIPLQQFVCDTCKQVIEKPEDGWLEWIHDSDKGEVHSFRITHHHSVSPLGGQEGCYQHGDTKGRSDDHLHNVMRHSILELLMHLDPGSYHDPDNKRARISDIRNYADTFRRLTIPYYEEARVYWDKAIANGVFDSQNEISIYMEDMLKRVIERYSEY